ncbi:MAG: AAA family ATPase [Magnetococcales bacterium]|nr:AAA family ATPase [Magnetococcales bacterium]
MIISVLNQKGGCGKTTIAVNLAALWHDQGRQTLLMDADPQRSASRWAEQGNQGGFPFPVHSLDMTLGARKVKAEIQAVVDGREMVVIDCPPELREPAMLASLLSDLVVVPVTPSPLDIWAAEAATGLAQDARELNTQGRPRVLLVPSKTHPQTLLTRDLGKALTALGEEVSPVGISQRVALAECVIQGQTINQYAPNSPACEELTRLSHHILTLLGG